MMELEEFVWRRSLKRAFNMLVDLAKGNLRFMLLIAGFGMGKTRLLQKALETLGWDTPIEFYVRRLADMKAGRCDDRREFEDAEVMEFGWRLGTITPENEDRAFKLLNRRFEIAESAGDPIMAHTVMIWMTWLAERLGRPAPDQSKLLSLCGIYDTHETRYPILISGSAADTPRMVGLKILTALDPSLASRRGMDRVFTLWGHLKELPLVLLVDEADQLSTDCLNEIRQLCEQTGTPFLLAGTKILLNRLQTTYTLRSLATRVEAHVTLDAVSAEDLRAAFPDTRNDILLAVWSAAGRNFRVAALIMKMLRRLREEFPGKRLTKRAVAFAASQVIAANPERVLIEEEEAEEARVAERAAQALPAVARGGGQELAARTAPARRVAAAGR